MKTTIKFPIFKDDYSDIIDANGVLVYSAGMNTIETVNEAEANRNFVFNALNAHEDAKRALEVAQKIIKIARQHFPKSVKNSDRFYLELFCAQVDSALLKAKGESC